MFTVSGFIDAAPKARGGKGSHKTRSPFGSIALADHDGETDHIKYEHGLMRHHRHQYLTVDALPEGSQIGGNGMDDFRDHVPLCPCRKTGRSSLVVECTECDMAVIKADYPKQIEGEITWHFAGFNAVGVVRYVVRLAINIALELGLVSEEQLELNFGMSPA